MKKLFCFFVISFFSFLYALKAQAQKDTLKLASIQAVSGKGPVTSGLYGFLTFENKKTSVMLTLSADDLEITYLRKFSKKITAGINGGYWFNNPYVSAQFIWTPASWFNTFHWAGYGFGVPEKYIEIKPQFYFAVNQTTITASKNFSGSYTLIHYLDNVPTHVGNIKYKCNINEKFSFFTSIGYDFTKKNHLFQLGGVYQRK